jgi:small-conductance mechanosensitive channel
MDHVLQLLLQLLELLAQWVLAALPRLALILLVIVGGLYIARNSRRVTRQALARSNADPLAKSVLSDLTYVGIVGLVGVVVLALLGVDVGSLIAGLGLTTLAIGFALRDVLENLAAGIVLLINQPFKVGDVIRLGVEEGEVTDMTVRVTIIKTAAGTEVSIPNRTIFTGIVENKTAYPARRYILELPLPAGRELVQACDLCARAAAAVDGVLADPPATCEAAAAADGSPRLTTRYWIASRDWRLALHTEVLDAVRRAIAVEPAAQPGPG